MNLIFNDPKEETEALIALCESLMKQYQESFNVEETLERTNWYGIDVTFAKAQPNILAIYKFKGRRYSFILDPSEYTRLYPKLNQLKSKCQELSLLSDNDRKSYNKSKIEVKNETLTDSEFQRLFENS